MQTAQQNLKVADADVREAREKLTKLEQGVREALSLLTQMTQEPAGSESAQRQEEALTAFQKYSR